MRRNILTTQNSASYTRADVEALIGAWESGPTWENVEARTDLLRARATLPERQRIALFYLCCGLPPKETAARLGVGLRTAKTLLQETVSNLHRKMNQGIGGDHP